MLHDREAEAETTERSVRRTFRLPEALEHLRKKIGSDSRAVVPYPNHEVTIDDRRAEHDAAARRSELHGVREEVPEDLLEATTVRLKRRRLLELDVELHAFRVGVRLDDLDGAWTTAAMSTGSISSVSFPDMIRLTSRRSSTSWVCTRAFRTTVAMA